MPQLPMKVKPKQQTQTKKTNIFLLNLSFFVDFVWLLMN